MRSVSATGSIFSEGAGSPSSRSLKGVLTGLALSVAVAAIIAVVLPAPLFSTRAIIGVSASDQSMRLALAQAAREAIRSKPVLARAAAALIGVDVTPPEPSLEERVAVLAGIGGIHATGREARLAEVLASRVRAVIGEGSASVDILASDEQAERAARYAEAVADAFVADADDRALELRRQRESAAAARTEALIKAASAAHARLLALGGTIADPAQAGATAAAQTAQAQARLDTIRAIVASAAPPLSDRRDVPDSVGALQRNYLDLAARLATARETLGDRHITIISLREGVARAGASLTAEWKRLERLAQTETDMARAREKATRASDAPVDAARRAAIDEARASAARADDAVAMAEAERPRPSDEHAYRIDARAPVPSATTGLTGAARALIAALAGLAAFAAALVAPRHRGSRRADKPASELKATVAVASVKASASKRRASFFEPDIDEAIMTPILQAASQEAASQQADSQDDDGLKDQSRQDESHEHESRDWREPMAVTRIASARVPEAGAREAMRALLVRLEMIESQGEIATIMVAANDAEIATTPVALALGRAAADTGRRVLIIESERPRGVLAASADPDGDPVLIDVFGTLRVALQAADGVGVTLAPALRNGRGIASALARGGETPFIDDPVAAFDLIVIDGGRAAEQALADAYLRVGRYTSRRDDERFLLALGATKDAFAGTMIGRVFVAPPAPSAIKGPPPVAIDQPIRSSRAQRVTTRPAAPPRTAMPRRRVAMR